MNNLKRLHFAAIFVTFLKGIRDFIIPIVISFFLGSSNQFEYVWFGILVLMFIYGLINWLTFRYKIKDGELYVQKGFIVKKKRYIQQNRVQSIDIKAGLLQRLFGLVMVRVETAGGGIEPEVNLVAVTKQEAEAIRFELLQKQTQLVRDAIEASKSNQMWHLGRKRLLIAALTSSGIGLTLSAVGALFSQVEQFLPERTFERTFGLVFGSGWTFVIGLIVSVIVIAWVVSILGTVLKYGAFRLEKYEDEIVLTRGLLEQRQLTLHTQRITALKYVRNIFRQPFGYTTIYVESAGGGSNDEGRATVLIPLIHERDIEKVINRFLPQFATQTIQLHAVPRRSLFRFLIRNVSIPLVAVGIAIYLIPSYGYYGLIFIAFMTLLGFFQYRDTGTAYNEQLVWLRYRNLSQVTILSERKKIQAAEVHTSFFQAKRKLANFQVSVLSSIAGKSFLVRDIDTKRAEDLLQWYSKEKNHDRAD